MARSNPSRKKRSRSKLARRQPREKRAGLRRAEVRDRLIRIGWQTLRTLLLVALPFVLLIRGSVLAHTVFGAPGWIALALGASLATLAVAAWGNWAWRRLTGRDRYRAIARNVALPLVLSFCLYCLIWLSSLNAKTPAIRDVYTDLHPSLRLALGTAILADDNVVITGITRSRADYARMGLRPVDDSLHFEQADGWIHAVDLRTRGRADVGIGLARLYFSLMGFRVLRHGGTGDHLHVALPRPRQ